MQPRRRWVGLLMTREGEATERSRAQGTQESRAPDSLLAAEGLPAGRATLPAGVEGGFIRRGHSGTSCCADSHVKHLVFLPPDSS